MAERPIRKLGDPVLRSVCREVESFDQGLETLVADLEETVASPGRAGLAANQIGVVRRVFYGMSTVKLDISSTRSSRSRRVSRTTARKGVSRYRDSSTLARGLSSYECEDSTSTVRRSWSRDPA